jgi:hypothetical protein
VTAFLFTMACWHKQLPAPAAQSSSAETSDTKADEAKAKGHDEAAEHKGKDKKDKDDDDDDDDDDDLTVVNRAYRLCSGYPGTVRPAARSHPSCRAKAAGKARCGFGSARYALP